jgi:hypothetical protein
VFFWNLFSFWYFSTYSYRLWRICKFFLCFISPLEFRIYSFFPPFIFRCNLYNFFFLLIVNKENFLWNIFFQRILIFGLWLILLMFLYITIILLIFGSLFGTDSTLGGFLIIVFVLDTIKGLKFRFFRRHLIFWEKSANLKVKFNIFDLNLRNFVKIRWFYVVLNFILI